MLPIDYPLHEMSKKSWAIIGRNINNGEQLTTEVEDKRYLVSQDGRFLAIARGNIQNNNEVLKPEKSCGETKKEMEIITDIDRFEGTNQLLWL